MALPTQSDLNRIANANEKKTEKQFKIRGYLPTKMDREGSNKRPDFLFSRGNDQLLVEVKTIFSSGRTESGEAISFQDPEVLGKVVSYRDPIILQKRLEEAEGQYAQLAKDEPQYGDLSFIVALFDESHFLPVHQMLKDDFYGCNKIGAVLMLLRDRIRHENLKKLPLEKLLNFSQSLKERVIGPSTLEWEIILNPKAIISLKSKTYLFDPCVVR